MGIAGPVGAQDFAAPLKCQDCFTQPQEKLLSTTGEVTPPSCCEVAAKQFEYLGDGKVAIMLKTETGELVRYTMAATAFMQSLKIATTFLNANVLDMLSDLKMF
jgi:hypothetical protein